VNRKLLLLSETGHKAKADVKMLSELKVFALLSHKTKWLQSTQNIAYIYTVIYRIQLITIT